jgi:hypothetical protein
MPCHQTLYQLSVNTSKSLLDRYWTDMGTQIGHQGVLLFSTLIGPATIMLVVSGEFERCARDGLVLSVIGKSENSKRGLWLCSSLAHHVYCYPVIGVRTFNPQPKSNMCTVIQLLGFTHYPVQHVYCYPIIGVRTLS